MQGNKIHTNDRLKVKLTTKGYRYLAKKHEAIGRRLFISKKDESYPYTCTFNTFLTYFGGLESALNNRNEGLFVADQVEVL
jgi:hypothetical protein